MPGPDGRIGHAPGPYGRIGHAELGIGDSVVMLADASPQGGPGPRQIGGSPVTVMVYVPDVDAAYAAAIEEPYSRIEGRDGVGSAVLISFQITGPDWLITCDPPKSGRSGALGSRQAAKKDHGLFARASPQPRCCSLPSHGC